MRTEVKNEAKKGVGIYQKWLKRVSEEEDIWRYKGGKGATEKAQAAWLFPGTVSHLLGLKQSELGESVKDEDEKGVLSYMKTSGCGQQKPGILIWLNSITLTAGWRIRGASVDTGKSVRLCINPWRCALACTRVGAVMMVKHDQHLDLFWR